MKHSFKHLLKLSLLLTLALPAAAQDERIFIDKSKLPAEGATVQNFVPAGWQIESQLGADLNADGRGDIVLKLIRPRPKDLSQDDFFSRDRALVLLLKTPKGTLKRAAVADRLLQCTGCGGAFYGIGEAPADLSFEKGVLILRQDHGSRELSEQTFRFRYDARSQKFVLIGFDHINVDRLTGLTLETSTNFLTGMKILTEIRTDEKTEKETRLTKKLKVAKSAINIEQIDYQQALWQSSEF